MICIVNRFFLIQKIQRRSFIGNDIIGKLQLSACFQLYHLTPLWILFKWISWPLDSDASAFLFQIIIEKESYRAFRKRLRYGFARIYLSYLTRTQRIMIDVDIIYRSGAWMRWTIGINTEIKMCQIQQRYRSQDLFRTNFLTVQIIIPRNSGNYQRNMMPCIILFYSRTI